MRPRRAGSASTLSSEVRSGFGLSASHNLSRVAGVCDAALFFADLPSSLEHGTLVSLDSALLLVGGRLGDGTWNDKLYLLDMATRQWLALSNTVRRAGGS